MYSYVESILRKKATNSGYENVGIGAVKMYDLFSIYRDGYIELSNPSLTKNVFVTLDALRQSDLPITNVAFNTWLGTIGNRTIYGSHVKPTLIKNTITASDAVQAGFKLLRVHPNDIGGVNEYPPEDKTDVFIRKIVSDINPIQKQTLTTVNGLLHINIPASSGLIIKGGGKSLEIEQDNHVGVISFEKIGDVTQVPIRRNMMDDPDEIRGYRGAIYLNLNRSLTNKSLMFSFCGRLYGMDGLIEKVNNQGVVRLNMHKLDLVDIIIDSKSKIDLSSLNLDERLYLKGALKIEDVIDNDVIVAMMELFQTFMIIVDSPGLVKRLHTANRTTLPGFFELYRQTNLPYISSKNVLNPYWKIIHPEQYMSVRRLHLKDTFYRPSVKETAGDLSQTDWVNGIDEITNLDYEIGHLLEITAERLDFGS